MGDWRILFQVHLYNDEEDKAAANEKCCSTERISNGLSCCNGIGYSLQTQVCADVSDEESGKYYWTSRHIV